MKTSISVAVGKSAMPQIMFSGDPRKSLSTVAELGFDGVDLFFPDPLGTDVSKIRRLLDDLNLKATMLAAQGDLMADGLFLNGTDTLPALLERSKHHLEQCRILDAMPNVGFIRGRHGQDGDSRARMAEGLARYCELAAGFGVDVLLEPICRYEIDSVLTVRQGIELWQAAGQPANMGLLLDMFHMNIEESSVCGAVCAAGSLTKHVHFVDNTRAVPGRGCLPLKDIYACLKGVGYDGFLGIEAISGADPVGEARDGLHFVQALDRGFA